MDLRDKQNFKGKNWNNKGCWNLSAVKKKKNVKNYFSIFFVSDKEANHFHCVLPFYFKAKQKKKKNELQFQDLKMIKRSSKIYVSKCNISGKVFHHF